MSAAPAPRGPAVAQAFKYNDRVAFALLPSLINFAGMVEGPVIAILVVGAMVAYILDALRQKELALGAVWISLGLANVTNIASCLTTDRDVPVTLTLMMIFLPGGILFLTGCWSSLQFRFLSLQHPVLALTLENLLITGTFPLSAAMLSWGMLSSVGASHAPFYAAVLACGLYSMFGAPLPSSYLTRSAAKASVGGRGSVANTTIQTRLQGALQASLLVTLPTLMYAAVHSAKLPALEHRWSLVLLLTSTLVFLEICPRALWWVPDFARALRRLVFVLAVIAGVAALEYRVVLMSFGQYIKLPAPWSWVAVTVGLYGAAFLALAYFSGWIPYLDPGFVGVLVILATTAGGVSLGLPLSVLPFCLAAGAGLALFQESERLEWYLTFVVGSLVCVGYFLYSNFWFLDIDLDGVHVHTLCKLLVAAALPALLIPGLIRLQARPTVCGLALLLQAGLLAFIEEHMFAGDHEEDMYPAYLVCATSAMGLALVRRLHSWHYISNAFLWALQCIYIAKLSMLLLPAAKLVLPFTGLVLATTPPIFLYRPTHPDGPPTRLKTWQALLHAKLVLLAVVHARFAIFDVVQAFYGGATPEGLLLGCLIGAVGVGLAPLVYICYPHSTALKRYLFLTFATAAMLMMLRPPLPIKGGAACPNLPFHLCPRLWDERHIPSHEVDDVNMYGEGLTRRRHWPLWLLLMSVTSAVIAATLPPSRRAVSTLVQVLIGSFSAVCGGGYIALEFLPGQGVIQLVILASISLLGAFLVLLRTPTGSSPAILPLFPIGWLLLFPVALIAQASMSLPPLPPEARRLFPDRTRISIDDERKANVRTAILCIYAVQGLLLALVLKIKVSAIVRQRGGSHGPRRVGVAGPPPLYAAAHNPALQLPSMLLKNPLVSCMVDPRQLNSSLGKIMKLDGVASASMQRLAAERASWMPTLGNIVTIFIFCLGIMLNFRIGEGRDEAIFVLAPVLLLLNQDPLLFRGLEDRRRYFVPCVAGSAYMLAVALASVREDGTPRMLPARVLLALCPVPNHVMLASYLWHLRKQSEWPLLFCTPLNALSLLFGGHMTRVLAGSAVIGAVVQIVMMRRFRRQGLQMI